MTRTGCGNLL
uniref:Uncharacterized protein n=1 Tax=Anguilla anguilla TaxID=7936 RepID=A0A0E9PRR2_ANGAN